MSHAVVTPRIYPRIFGKKVVALLGPLMTQGQGKPPDSVLPRVKATVAFSKRKWEDWPEADLRGVAAYLRGNKHLDIPPEWKAVLPTAM